MKKLLTLKRPFIWIKRFRRRRGHGVHSPFAFNLITNVIYEKSSYYAYKELNLGKTNKENSPESEKLNRLLFRLVNWAQPETIIDAGKQSISSDYIKAAKSGTDYIHITDASALKLREGNMVDFLYIHYCNDAAFAEEVFYSSIEHIREKSVFVIQGICYSDKMKNLWRKIINEHKVGITFDLYDVGIVLFDKKKTKQHHIVNF